MSVAIVDYGSGNLRSAAKAFERAAREAGRNDSVLVSADPDVIRRAGHVVLPGVGAFADCKAGLDTLPGMVEALNDVVRQGRPLLGICVGMQLFATLGREYGEHPGLDWIAGEVVPLEPDDPALKVPHMGWNELSFVPDSHPLLRGLVPGRHAYFVHSYQFRTASPAHRLATVDYGGPVTAMIGRDSLVGTQFHPEKSQATGLTLITNFLRWRP